MAAIADERGCGTQTAAVLGMSVANTYQQSDTPLPQVAARAARQAMAAARPHTLTIAQACARLLLTAAIMSGFAGLFAALIAGTLH